MHTDTYAQEIRRLRDRVGELEEELRQLREDLRQPAEAPPRWKLTPSEWRVLWLLYKVQGYVSRERMQSLFYEGKGSVSSNTIGVYVLRTRRKLDAAAAGVEIETDHFRGYMMPQRSRDMLRLILAAQGEQPPVRRPAVPSAAVQRASGKPYAELRKQAREMWGTHPRVTRIAKALKVADYKVAEWTADLPAPAREPWCRDPTGRTMAPGADRNPINGQLWVDLERRAIELRGVRWTLQDIANELRVSKSAVFRWVKGTPEDERAKAAQRKPAAMAAYDAKLKKQGYTAAERLRFQRQVIEAEARGMA